MVVLLLSFTMKSSKHHSVVIRSGATIDAYNLSDLFNSLGFDTQCHDSITKHTCTEMRQIATK